MNLKMEDQTASTIVQEFYPMYFNFFLVWNEVKQHQYLSNEM